MAVSFGPFPTIGDSRFTSEWGGAAFAGIFGLLTILHLVQGCYYRLWKVATAAVAGGLAASAGYILQAAGSRQRGDPSDTDNVQPYLLATAFILLQIAPLCITLVPYATLNRLARTRFVPAHDSLPDDMRRPWPSNGRWIAAWPVWVLLVIAAAAQAAAVAFLVYCGLTTSSAYDIPRALLVAAGLVWAGGLAAQGVAVLILLAAVTHAYATLPPARPGGQQERDEAGTVRPSLPPRRRRKIVWLLMTTYGVLALLVMRIVYRTVEAVMAAEGKSTASIGVDAKTAASSASRSTLYALVLDGLPTALALLLLCACHAGWALPATEARHSSSQGGGRSGGSNTPTSGGDDDADERMDALHDLESPVEGRGYFGQPSPAEAAEGGQELSTEQVLLQQRAALQRHYRQRQRQQHRQSQFRPRHPPPPVVEALARFSLSASLSVSLPRESFVGGERPARIPAPGEPDEAAGGAPQRLLARLSMDNFILFRFLNTPSRSTSARSGGARTIPQSVRSAISRATSQSHGGGGGSQSRSQSHGTGTNYGDDPFAGFDDVAQAGLQTEEAPQQEHQEHQDREPQEHQNQERENALFHDSDSRRTCDSPDEKEKLGPEWT
ncbi:hypothetical protein Sste5346_009794 [Sporothrix stenoceras]|uniref:Uncharacterized protein n=1 Tax=Sporothrix stenoceras TaxID=5173 RepID=A0ABR3YIS3_9PEZI